MGGVGAAGLYLGRRGHLPGLDFDREGIGHVSFGHGPHHCMGAMPTRMESEVMLSTLLRRCPELRLAGRPEAVVWQSKGLICGPKELLVTG
ncbi:hypothetical protein ACFQ7J_37130 [Streptomyces sp. NPDC056501]|uniref:hypothetical protein n=1 Tax=Streptomyces sp. NPDC056501 TaxID=3345841 RepID=UPI0036CC1BDF